VGNLNHPAVIQNFEINDNREFTRLSARWEPQNQNVPIVKNEHLFASCGVMRDTAQRRSILEGDK